jgi:hypothetical protein
MTTDQEKIEAANKLDQQYAEAEAFDKKQFEAWLEENTVVFTKRTNFPKLGYIIHLLNEEGIPSALYGESFHAPILRVAKGQEDAAWRILMANFPQAAKALDDVEDDDPYFQKYASTTPDPDLWE